MNKSAAHNTTPQSLGGKGSDSGLDSSHQQSQFISMALTMAWHLAVVVLVPVIGGVYLDKATDNSSTFLIAGLVVAIVASTVVMWRTMQKANSLPVPKLTDTERKQVQKSYEEDDD